MFNIFKNVIYYYKIARLIIICVKNKYKIEIAPRTSLFSDKVIIRVDDLDEEYKSALYTYDYRPISLEDGTSFRKVLIKTYGNVINHLKELKKHRKNEF